MKEDLTKEQVIDTFRYTTLIEAWDYLDAGNRNMLQYKDKIYELYNELKTLPKVKQIKYEIVNNLLNLVDGKIDLYIDGILIPAFEEIKLSNDKLEEIRNIVMDIDIPRLHTIWKYDEDSLKFDETYNFYAVIELIVDYTAKVLGLLNSAITENSSMNAQNKENEKNGFDKNGLTTVQKLLLYRFLQKYDKFPKRTPYQTDKQELEIIGAAAGATYEDLKKAKPKVDEILALRVTRNQVHAKVQDLQKVQTVFAGMELTNIVSEIEDLIQKLTAIH